MRLIDANALQEEYVRLSGRELSLINDAPTVDAEPVVRCCNCRWGREVCGNIECSVDSNLPPEYHGYNWFCPNGERGKDETN